MKDYLLDIVKNTVFLGPEVIIKVSGEEKKNTVIKVRREDNSIIVRGELNKSVAELQGVFGIGKLNFLNGLLNLECFRDKEAAVSVKREERNGASLPTEIVFEAKNNATASYRLTHEQAIPKQANDPNIEYTVTITQPTKKRIAEFSQLASIYGGIEDSFGVKTVDNKLVFLIGSENVSSHKASFTFAEEVEGKVTPGYTWNISDFLSVLKLTDGAKSEVKFRDEFIEVDIDTGLCKYQFVLPGRN